MKKCVQLLQYSTGLAISIASICSAEIRVLGKNGKSYAAPNLIYHYIKDCGYFPPQEFIDAVKALGI